VFSRHRIGPGVRAAD